MLSRTNPIHLALLLALSIGTHAKSHSFNTRSQGIQWRPCEFEVVDNRTLCGSLLVPLDYTDTIFNKTLDLELIKVPAINSPPKGSILMNFGGPGVEGLQNLNYLGPEYFLRITGGNHDLISFNPRGTGKTLPFSCYENSTDRVLGYAQTPQALAQSSNSATAVGRLWAEGKLISDRCYAKLKDTGDLIGMAFTARDMLQIVDALNEDGLLRYFGYSGGAVLGATAVAMFPERVGAVIIDAVLNPFEYYYNEVENQFLDSDKVFSDFFAACVANPKKCTLARNNASAAELEAAVSDALNALKTHPLAVSPGAILDYSYAVPWTFIRLYQPLLWSTLGDFLDDLITGNVTTLPEFPPILDGEANSGIKCGDKAPRHGTLAELTPKIEAVTSTSRFFGDATVGVMAQCAQWQFKAKERYSGDFRVKSKNPVLVINNRFDPTTPLVAAYNISAAFEGSVVLERDAHGHTILAQGRSECTEKIIREYYNEGKVPQAGTVCAVDTPLFADPEEEQSSQGTVAEL